MANIKLPPLPRLQVPRIDADVDLMDIRCMAQWAEGIAKDYAITAIEADRQQSDTRTSRSVEQLKEALLSRNQRFVATYSEVKNLIEYYEAALQSQDREDALRYRWLREQCKKTTGGLVVCKVKDWELEPWSCDRLDQDIDRARNDKGDLT